MAFAAAARVPSQLRNPLDPTCTRCEEGCAETFLHRHWLCAGNLFDHPNEAAKQAHQRLSRRAQTEAADTPCLWFRGLLPAEYTTGLLPPPASEATAMVFAAEGASAPGYLIRNHPLFCYTDGSRGKYGHDARLIRAGWGAVGVSCKVPFPQRAAAWGALYGPLPGELQGSDRAEIWALLQLLERTLGDLVVGTDCDYLVRCFHKRWWARKGSFKNGDLWSRIGTALNRKREVTVSHVLAPDSPLDLAAHTWTSVVGNELADAFAEKGALFHEVPVDVVSAVSEADSLAVLARHLDSHLGKKASFTHELPRRRQATMAAFYSVGQLWYESRGSSDASSSVVWSTRHFLALRPSARRRHSIKLSRR